MTMLLLADAATGLLVGFPLVIILLVGLASLFWLWMLVDVITTTSLKDTDKIIWVLVVLFLHILGALLYFFIARGSRTGAPPAA